jgi:hypothetical protein
MRDFIFFIFVLIVAFVAFLLDRGSLSRPLGGRELAKGGVGGEPDKLVNLISQVNKIIYLNSLDLSARIAGWSDASLQDIIEAIRKGDTEGIQEADRRLRDKSPGVPLAAIISVTPEMDLQGFLGALNHFAGPQKKHLPLIKVELNMFHDTLSKVVHEMDNPTINSVEGIIKATIALTMASALREWHAGKIAGFTKLTGEIKGLEPLKENLDKIAGDELKLLIRRPVEPGWLTNSMKDNIRDALNIVEKQWSIRIPPSPTDPMKPSDLMLMANKLAYIASIFVSYQLADWDKDLVKETAVAIRSNDLTQMMRNREALSRDGLLLAPLIEPNDDPAAMIKNLEGYIKDDALSTHPKTPRGLDVEGFMGILYDGLGAQHNTIADIARKFAALSVVSALAQWNGAVDRNIRDPPAKLWKMVSSAYVQFDRECSREEFSGPYNEQVLVDRFIEWGIKVLCDDSRDLDVPSEDAPAKHFTDADFDRIRTAQNDHYHLYGPATIDPFVRRLWSSRPVTPVPPEPESHAIAVIASRLGNTSTDPASQRKTVADFAAQKNIKTSPDTLARDVPKWMPAAKEAGLINAEDF